MTSWEFLMLTGDTTNGLTRVCPAQCCLRMRLRINQFLICHYQQAKHHQITLVCNSAQSGIDAIQAQMTIHVRVILTIWPRKSMMRWLMHWNQQHQLVLNVISNVMKVTLLTLADNHQFNQSRNHLMENSLFNLSHQFYQHHKSCRLPNKRNPLPKFIHKRPQVDTHVTPRNPIMRSVAKH